VASETINNTGKWRNRVHFIFVTLIAMSLLSLLTFVNWTGNAHSNESLLAAIEAFGSSVFEEDHRACLDAGMNDFVSKPIDLNETLVKLDKWLPNDGPG
jgi:Tfp pilus assembly protein PilO